MPKPLFHPADLEVLNGGIRQLREISGMPCIKLHGAGEAFTLLASVADVPLPLSR